MTNREPKFRDFGAGGDARHVIGETVARWAGRSRIAPNDWASAGAILKALKEQGFDLKKPTP